MAKKLMSVFGMQSDEADKAEVSSPEADEALLAHERRGTPARSIMTLGKTLYFKGELAADEDLVLLGRVDGSIVHTENLTIGIGGIVKGDLQARTITVKGLVVGDLHASEWVMISPTADVLGNITAPRVSIVEGCKFNGAVRMPEVAPAAAARTPAPAITAKVEPITEQVED